MLASIIEGFTLAYLTYDIFLIWKLEKEDDDETNEQNEDDGDNETQHTCFDIPLPDKWTVFRGIFIFLSLIDFVIHIVSSGNSVRFALCTRPLLLVLRAQALRVVFVGCLYAGLRILRVLFLIACDVIFFGFVGFVLFSKVEEEKGFETPFNGMRTMLLVLTAPGTVLVDMEPLQRHSDGWASLFFVIFVVITTMIFQKLVLATAYRSYKGYQKADQIIQLSIQGHW